MKRPTIDQMREQLQQMKKRKAQKDQTSATGPEATGNTMQEVATAQQAGHQPITPTQPLGNADTDYQAQVQRAYFWFACWFLSLSLFTHFFQIRESGTNMGQIYSQLI